MKTTKIIASFATTLALLALMSLPAAAQPDPGRRPGGGNPEALFPSQTVPKHAREKKIVAILEDMDQTQRRGNMSVPANDGRLLRVLAESTGAKARRGTGNNLRQRRRLGDRCEHEETVG